MWWRRAGMIGSMPRRARRARSGLLSSPRSAIRRSGRWRGRPSFPGRPIATASSVYSRRVTSAGGRRVQGLLPAESPRHRPAPATVCPCRAWSCRRWVPCFRRHEAAIGTACTPTNLCLVIRLGQEAPPAFAQHPRLCPLLEPPPTPTGAALSSGDLAPLSAGPEPSEAALKAASARAAGASTPLGHFWRREIDADGRPWLWRKSSPCHVLPPLLG